MDFIIIALGLLVFIAHLFSVLFNKTGVPEVLPLMLIGLLLGPIFNLVNPSDFGGIDKVFTRLMLIIILFQSGLHLKLNNLQKTIAQSSGLFILNFIFSACLVALLSHYIFGFVWITSFILGTILGSNSVAIVVPLTEKLKMSDNCRTALTSESTLGGVFSIVLTIALLDMIKENNYNASILLGHLFYSFFISFLVGSIAGVFWTTILGNIRKLKNSIFLTLAFVMLVYSSTQLMGADGSIGVFVFGIVAGNIETLKKRGIFNLLEVFNLNPASKTFNETEKNFFSEVSFIFLIFFFVYIGISLEIENYFTLLFGLIFALMFIVLRLPLVANTLKSITKKDALFASIIMPKGLITAVLCSLAVQANVPQAHFMQELIFTIILFSIVLTTLFSGLIDKNKYSKSVTELFFNSQQEDIKE